MTVLCLIEIDAGGAADASMRAVTVASRLAASAGEDLAAAWFGPADAIDPAELFIAGIVKAYAIGSGELVGYAPVAWARAIAGLAARLPGPVGPASGPEQVGGPEQAGGSRQVGGSGQATGPGQPGGPEQAGGSGKATAVVAASTDHGNEVLAHLGAITGVPMAANCVSASRAAADEVRLVRERWGGSLLEEAVLNASLALLTVAADAVAAEPATAEPGVAEPGLAEREAGGSAQASVEPYEPELEDGDLLVRAVESAERGAGVSLATARVVVGGGRGVGGAEGFAALEELAGLLGAAVGVSRVVTSQGWRPHQQQVGQTGTKITPELYLACGISGAIQHMAGCQGAKTIVAINTDAEAPIVARADYAVIGDLHQVIPALVEALRERAAGSP